MLKTLWAIVREKKIVLLEPADIREGTRALVTFFPDNAEPRFWKTTSQISLDKVWNNPEDDIYAQLLEK